MVNDWIESIKSSLEAYGKQSDETLTSLYAAARDEYNKSYNAALDTLNARYEADKKQAYTKKAADDKNMGEYLAARGLSRSGDSVSARIASDVSLGNTLSALSGGLRESQNTLASDYGKALANLAVEEANKKAENDRWTAEFSASLASTAAENALREEQNKLERDKFDHTVEMDNNALNDLKAELEAYEAELKKREEALKDAEAGKPNTGGNAGNTGNTGNTGNDDDGYDGSMLNPSELARDIVSQYASGKTLSTQAENFAVLKYLRNLKREGIDEAYYDLLVSNLKALGFTGANVDYTTLLNTVNDSIENYYHVQERLYKLFREKGFEDELALAGSKDRAAGLQFEYLYRHSPSIAFFELAVYAADLNLDDLPVFYSNAERQNRDPNEYDIVLGAALGK
ncbi:MAG: hypothetical protein ACI3ZE_01995 [Candidatus Woodwardiibium sp.]